MRLRGRGTKQSAQSHRQGIVTTFALLMLIGTIGAASAFGEAEYSVEDPPAELAKDETVGPTTNPEAAEELPHENLGRPEALELLEEVFPSVTEGAPASLGGLEVEKFYSDHVAVVVPEESPEAEASESTPQPELLTSTLPLRTENDQGQLEQVDLTLDRSEGELRPINPLVDVAIPEHLGEAISFPETGIDVSVAGVPDGLTASTIDDSAAFFPNVATDSDLTITPTELGVETLAQLRSPEAPQTETLQFSLPPGATLTATDDGGARVVQGEDTLLVILPPSASDANGTPVPASLTVEASAMTIEVEPPDDAVYPILVDPVLHQWLHWYSEATTKGIGDTWKPKSTSSLFATSFMGGWGQFGLNIFSYQGIWSGAWPEARYTFYVPRYFQDLEDPAVKEVPTTYITKMTFTNLYWWIEESQPYKINPTLSMGLWDENIKNWSSYGGRWGTEGQLTDPNWVYNFENIDKVTDVKQGIALMEGSANGNEVRPRHLWIGAADTYLTDNDRPEFISPTAGPTQWVDSQPSAPIKYAVSDRGLGIHDFHVLATTGAGQTSDSTTSIGCTGIPASPCPRTVRSETQPLNYDPSVMPQGEDWVKIYPVDVVLHGTPAEFTEKGLTPIEAKIKVDHTAPNLALSGPATELSALGKNLASYKLHIDATDGTTSSPQSGVVKTTVKVDGKVVDDVAPGCGTKNCAVSRDWFLESANYSAGSHLIEVIATDGVGRSAAKSLSVDLHPAPPPSLTLSGTMTEQAALSTTRPRYTVKASAWALAGSEVANVEAPSYISSFGSAGTSNGQFAHPAGIAVDPKGNLWVVDENHYRVQKFNEAGEYQSSFGSQGSENGKFNRPTDIAVDPKGNLWVTDAGNNRIEKFNEKGEYVTKVGTIGTGNLQFKGPESIAIDSKGNIWVGDTYNGRLQELNEKGEFIRIVGSKGSGSGQIGQSTGIAIGPGGNVWVADWENNRVIEFSETGTFIRQFGGTGTGKGQFSHPDVIDVDPQGNVLVGDQSNNRVQQFNQNGEYVTQFGSAGTGAGQFSFGWPMGIASDSRGHLWISDTGNNRVQRWNQRTKSEITVSITVDGKQVLTKQILCITETCLAEPEWTMDSLAYSTGTHKVQVTATDGLGRTTTKTTSPTIQRDTTKPALTSSGSLVQAPQGWVVQKNYTFNAKSTDVGFGSTALIFKIDGKPVSSVAATCPDGACSQSLTKTVDMSAYAGGSHTAEITASDGAGNVAKQIWTINVDPEGHISMEEAADTLEAVDGTSPVNTVGPSIEEEGYEGTAPGLGLEQTSEAIEATGTEVPTTLAPEPDLGMTLKILPADALGVPCGADTKDPVTSAEMESAKEEIANESEEKTASCSETPGSQEEPPAGDFNHEPIEITPLGTSAAASSYDTVGEAAAVAANTSGQVDSIVRPLYDGAMVFEAIRSSEAPEQYSWRVALEPDQELRLVSSQYAEVDYEGSHPAMSISAVPAHDAIGTTVPTELSVKDDVVTLTAHHRASSFVYPVVAGSGWQGGFSTYKIEMPPIEGAENTEEVEANEIELLEGADHLSVAVRATTIGPPVQAVGADPPATTSSAVPTVVRPFAFTDCMYDGKNAPKDAPLIPKYIRSTEVEAEWNCHHNLEGDPVAWAIMVNGHVHYKFNKWVWVNANQFGCHHWGRAAQANCFRTEKEPTTGHVDLVGFFRTPPGTVYAGPFGHCEILKGIIFSAPPARTKWGWLIYNPYRHRDWPVPEDHQCEFSEHWPF